MTIFEKLVNRAIIKRADSEIRDACIIEDNEVITKKSCTNDGVLFNIKEKGIQVIKGVLESMPATTFNNLVIPDTFKIHTVSLSNMKQTDKLKLYTKLMESTDIYGVIGFDSKNTTWNISNPITYINPLFNQANITKLAIYSYEHKQNPQEQTISNYIKYFATVDTVINTYGYLRKEKKSDSVKVAQAGCDYWNLQYYEDTVRIYINTYENKVVLPSTESEEYTLIPHLFVAKGVIAPYYGFSYMVSTPASKKGYPLSSMHSANIHPNNNSICVGSNPPNLYDSYRTLNYSNLDSAYIREIFPYNYAEIAEASKQYTILKIKGVLNGDQTETSS